VDTLYTVRFREVSWLSSFKNFNNQTTGCGDIAYCLWWDILFWAILYIWAANVTYNLIAIARRVSVLFRATTYSLTLSVITPLDERHTGRVAIYGSSQWRFAATTVCCAATDEVLDTRQLCAVFTAVSVCQSQCRTHSFCRIVAVLREITLSTGTAYNSSWLPLFSFTRVKLKSNDENRNKERDES